MKKGGFLLIGLFILLVGLRFASAEILLSQTEKVYNLGDLLDIQASIKATTDIQDFFKISLKCEGNSLEIYKAPDFLYAGETKSINITIPLMRSVIGNLTGNCNLDAYFGEDNSKSQAFLISNKIDTTIWLNNFSFNPGEKVIVKGEAVKANGELANGFAEIVLSGTDLSSNSIVEKGQINASLVIPKNIKAGSYVLEIRVYEKIGKEKINEGIASETINIKQIPKKIGIVINKQELEPGDTLELRTEIFDQAEDLINDASWVEIINPKGKVIAGMNVGNKENKEIKINNSYKPGEYTVKASYGELEEERILDILEKRQVDFEVVNETLIIKNTGNVPYQGEFDVKIGKESRTLRILLDVGEVKRYVLSAPEGVYDIEVDSNGTTAFTEPGVILTGGVVGIREEGASSSSGYFLIWVFVVLVLGMLVFLAGRRVIKKPFFAHPSSIFKKREENKERGGVKKVVPSSQESKEAEQTLVIKGNKERASIIALKIKNFDKLDKKAKQHIENVLSSAKDKKIAISKGEDFRVLILTPTLTKTFKNEIEAVKLALSLSDNFNNYNKNSKEKISFGIGLNFGEIIAGKSGDKLKFTSIGDSVQIARKIAEQANNTVLLSSAMRTRTMSDVKSEEKGEGVYAVKEVMDRERYNDFIKNFLKKIEEEKKEKKEK